MEAAVLDEDGSGVDAGDGAAATNRPGTLVSTV